MQENRNKPKLLTGARSDRAPARVEVPVGVERVLYLAASDPEFHAALFADRRAALVKRGCRLRPEEEAVLLAIPSEQLASTIAHVDVSATNVKRRGFLGAVAASAAALAAAEVFTSCGGERADDPTRKDGGTKDKTSGGASDLKPASDRVTVHELGPAPTGIRPGGD